MSLNNLPDETILTIASFLNRLSDINALARISRRFYIALNRFLYRFDLDKVPGTSRALCWAAQKGNEATLQFALEARPLQPSSCLAMYALHIVTAAGNLNMVKELVSRGISLNERRRRGRTAVHDAICHKQTAVLRWMLDNGGDLTKSWPGDKVQTALHVATSSHGSLEMTKFLLKGGLDIEARDEEMKTPLARAVHYWSPHDTYERALRRIYVPTLMDSLRAPGPGAGGVNVDLIRLLLAHGANPDARDVHGKTPRGYIYYHPIVDVRRLFMELPPRKPEMNGAAELELE